MQKKKNYEATTPLSPSTNYNSEKPHRRSAAVIEYAGPASSSSTHDSVTDGRLPGREPPPQRLCMVTLPLKNSAQITCTVLSSGSKSTTFWGTHPRDQKKGGERQRRRHDERRRDEKHEKSPRGTRKGIPYKKVGIFLAVFWAGAR